MKTAKEITTVETVEFGEREIIDLLRAALIEKMGESWKESNYQFDLREQVDTITGDSWGYQFKGVKFTKRTVTKE